MCENPHVGIDRPAVKRDADEGTGRRAGSGGDRRDVELALQVSHWLGASVLQPPPAPATAHRNHDARQRTRLTKAT